MKKQILAMIGVVLIILVVVIIFGLFFIYRYVKKPELGQYLMPVPKQEQPKNQLEPKPILPIRP